MLFHRFANQQARRAFGGSCFIEMQFCRMPMGTWLSELVSVQAIHHWMNDSLYVHGDDQNEFFSSYGKFFPCGVYSNLEIGPMDLWGINYYAPALLDGLIDALLSASPADAPVLIEWLSQAKSYNGFYILGI